MPTSHGINRIERVGFDIVAMGYRDWQGLSVSMIDLAGLEDRQHADDARPVRIRGAQPRLQCPCYVDGGLMGSTVQKTGG